MDKCLRFTLWFCFLLFSEQLPASAKPLGSFHFKSIRNNVKCDSNVTLTSTSDATQCLAAAKRNFEVQLENAKKICRDPKDRLVDAISVLKNGNKTLSQDQADCVWKEKPFPEFVTDFETFTKAYNSH